MSPTQRTLKYYRDLGYICWIVEKFNVYIKRRQDLFGFIDIVCIKEDEKGVLGIQSTSGDNISARIKKSIAVPALKVWLMAGNRFVVQGFRKNIKGRYVERQVEITLKDLVQ